MAATNKSKAAAKAKVEKAPEFVTVAQFSALEGAVNKLVDLVLAQQEAAKNAVPAPVVVETPIEKEIRKAGPDTAPINPEWEEMVAEIIGDALDHCEVTYLKGGGTLFTIVIKREFSNAPEDYLEMRKVDRRSKEIGSEGITGVEAYAKLVKQNLSRPKNT